MLFCHIFQIIIFCITVDSSGTDGYNWIKRVSSSLNRSKLINAIKKPARYFHLLFVRADCVHSVRSMPPGAWSVSCGPSRSVVVSHLEVILVCGPLGGPNILLCGSQLGWLEGGGQGR